MDIKTCKCGSTNFFTKQSGNNTGLYCSNCGKWNKWLGKDEARLYECNQQNTANIYCDADDIKDLDLGLAFRQSIANYINLVIRQAQADAWNEGFQTGKRDKTSYNADYLNPYV